MNERIDFGTINPNDAIPELTKHINQEKINKWADAVDDHNPLHVDPDYAKKTKFKSTIAHGPLVLSYISEMMSNWVGTGWIEGGKLLDIKFKAPVKPGDRITVRGRVKEKSVVGNEILIQCDVFIENQKEVKVTTGRAIVFVN